MTPAFLIIAIAVVLILCVFGSVLFALRREILAQRAARENDHTTVLLNQNLQGLEQRIQQNTQTMNERLDRATQIFASVNKELGMVQEIGHSLKNFQEFLSSPKMRGNLGEHILYDSMEKVFSSEHFSKQYKFRGGQTVDAVIKTEKGILPIDAKFPMESFKRIIGAVSDEERVAAMREFVRAVKKHIGDISEKYILPEEGTLDFAVLYVPSEQVFYEVMTGEHDLLEYAREQKILLVSPNSFFHFLKVILMGLEHAKLAEGAQEVWELLKGMQHDFKNFGEQLSVLSRHLTNAKNSVDAIQTEYGRMEGKLGNVRLLK